MKYTLSSRIIHWIMAVIIISLIAVGIYMTEFLNSDSENRSLIYGLHKSFGVVILMLFIARIINRFINKPPALPDNFSKNEKIGANIGHIVLYILMLLVPLSGYLMSNSYGYPVKLFGLELPFLVTTNYDLGKVFSALHFYFGYAILAVIVIHITAVIKHRYFEKDKDVLNRML